MLQLYTKLLVSWNESLGLVLINSLLDRFMQKAYILDKTLGNLSLEFLGLWRFRGKEYNLEETKWNLFKKN